MILFHQGFGLILGSWVKILMANSEYRIYRNVWGVWGLPIIKKYIHCTEYSQFIMYCIYIKMKKFIWIQKNYIILEDEITEQTKVSFILLNISLSQVYSPVFLLTKTKTFKHCFIEIKLKKKLMRWKSLSLKHLSKNFKYCLGNQLK